MIIISFENGAKYSGDGSMGDVSLAVEKSLTNSENIDRSFPPRLVGKRESYNFSACFGARVNQSDRVVG